MERPRTRYARAGDAYVAYQVFGEGPIDLVCYMGWYSDIDSHWDIPVMTRFYERLASFSRVICFDRRGHGLSDSVDPDSITLEEWMDDLRAVMDTVGSERAVILGATEAGPMAILFAATYPERTTALVLINTWACPSRRPDYPWGLPPSARERAAEGVLQSVLAENEVDAFSFYTALPSAQADRGGRELGLMLLRQLKHATRPSMIRELMHATLETDVRTALPMVRVPTLVVHRAGETWTRPEHGRYIAERISEAKYVELPGEDHLPFLGDQDSILDEVEEFVTGVRPTHEPDRVLATVLFTDVVSSTERAVEVGDRRWREVIDAHNRLVRRELERHRGQEVSTAGDAFLATFDGPARAVRCACSIVDGVRNVGLDVRAGLHTGEIELAGNDVAGIAVHIGKRVSDLAGPGEVLVSRTVVDLVNGSGLEFADRGSHALKGVPGEFQLYAVER